MTVTSDTKTQVDLHSTTVAHNVTAEEFDRMPKARSFQGIALTSPGVNQGDIEGGFQVNGASGAENSFTVDGVNTNSLLYGSSRQDTVFEYLQEVQVKTGGIAAEYGGALGGVISAVTKSGGNRFTRRRPLLLLRQRDLGAVPVQRLQLSPLDDTTVLNVQDDKQNEQPQRGRRLDRRSDPEGSPVLLRIGVAAVHRPHERLPVLERHRAGIDPAVADRDADVRQGDLLDRAAAGQRQRPLDAATLDRHALGLRRHRPELHQQLAGRQRGADPSRLRPGSDQRQRQRRHHAERPSSLSVRGGLFSDNYDDTGVSTTTAVVWNTPSIGVAGVPAEPAAAERRAEHAARAHHQ